MGDTTIITNDDETAVIVTPESPSFAIHAEDEDSIITSPETPSLVVHAEPKSYIVAVAEELPTIVQEDEPVSHVIASIGSGDGGNLYRGIINYDGGRPDTHYGDAIHLDGGGVVDGRNHPI